MHGVKMHVTLAAKRPFRLVFTWLHGPGLGPRRTERCDRMAARPNTLFFHVDNLGFGELSCYSGGPFRGTWTRRAAGAWWPGRRPWVTCCLRQATAAVYGKWHVGEGPGRWPTDHGFAEWYGPPRTYDEAL
jgi:hypothetical protein